MTIAEMHVWFRQYAQQMGMQNVRAILPEQIDLLINTSITDIVNQIITQNINVANDRIITDNSKIGQINALRSLYKVKKVDAIINDNGSTVGRPFTNGAESYIRRIHTSVDNLYCGEFSYYAVTESIHSGTASYNLSSIDKDTYDVTTNKVENVNNSDKNNYKDAEYKNYAIRVNPTTLKTFEYLYLVDFSINYKKGTTITNYFPVRIIDDRFLADTLNDFVLRPRLRTPVAVVYNNQLDLYIDILDSEGNLPQNLETNELRVSYIDKPAKVQYLSDIQGNDVNCDLPDYLHVDILKHAVDLYNTSIGGNLYSAQQQAQGRETNNVAQS